MVWPDKVITELSRAQGTDDRLPGIDPAAVLEKNSRGGPVFYDNLLNLAMGECPGTVFVEDPLHGVGVVVGGTGVAVGPVGFPSHWVNKKTMMVMPNTRCRDALKLIIQILSPLMELAASYSSTG